MPATYFLSPFCPPIWEGETNLYIDAEIYEKALAERWDIKILARNLPNPGNVLTWDVYDKGSVVIEGGLQSGNQIITLQGGTRDMAAFVVWHRSVVTNDSPLYLFDEGLHLKFEINSDTQISDIVNAINKS